MSFQNGFSYVLRSLENKGGGFLIIMADGFHAIIGGRFEIIIDGQFRHNMHTGDKKPAAHRPLRRGIARASALLATVFFGSTIINHGTYLGT